MGWLTLAWTVVKRLPWKVLGPVLVVAALGLCVRHQIQANARADAYQRVAQMAAKYSQQQEKLRMETRKQMEDTVAQYEKEIEASYKVIKAGSESGGKQMAKLREQLQGEQRTLLDSAETNYRAAIGSLVLNNAKKDAIIRVRTQERDDAERLLADSHRYNDQLQRVLQAEAKRSGGSGLWKAATVVVAAVGTIAYVTK